MQRNATNGLIKPVSDSVPSGLHHNRRERHHSKGTRSQRTSLPQPRQKASASLSDNDGPAAEQRFAKLKKKASCNLFSTPNMHSADTPKLPDHYNRLTTRPRMNCISKHKNYRNKRHHHQCIIADSVSSLFSNIEWSAPSVFHGFGGIGGGRLPSFSSSFPSTDQA